VTVRTPRGFALALLAFVVAVTVLAATAVVLERRSRRPAPRASELDVGAALGGGTFASDGSDASDEREDGFRRATEPRRFDFPADHGAHDGFRTEWWYVTGNLFAADGRAFGVQLTFFRNALTALPADPASRSRWRSAHVWMAHFALSDEKNGSFRFAERFAREAVGLAGATSAPFRVALEDWSLASAGSNDAAFSPLRLRARDDDFAVDLELEVQKPPVLQGDHGLSQKGAAPGNASYYYSVPRLAARGTVTLAGLAKPVTGEAWLDREWSTSALGSEIAGWDWFALQLDDGRELMFYALRRKDGGIDPLSRGSLVAADGGARTLRPEELSLRPLSTWTSPGGATYPARWSLVVPGEGLDLELTPRVEGQELAVTVRYWEGAVAVRGVSRGRPIAGHGFVEMTGYGSAGGASAAGGAAAAPAGTPAAVR
jgi:predicted secreted hydrolase